VSDPNQNFNNGLFGQGPAPSGGAAFDQWTAGSLARQLNAQTLAAHNAASAPVAGTPFTPVSSATVPFSGGGGGQAIAIVGRKVNPIGGILLLLAAVPLWQYSLPLWIVLYPGSAVIAGLVAIGVFVAWGPGAGLTPEGRLAVSGFFAFVAAWPLTLVDQARASRKSYRSARHVVRLVLIFFWAVYALTLFQQHLTERLSVFYPVHRQAYSIFVWNPLHIGLGAIAVVAMHFWLSVDRPQRSLWQRVRGRR
jgi:hypothetical protein